MTKAKAIVPELTNSIKFSFLISLFAKPEKKRSKTFESFQRLRERRMMWQMLKPLCK